MATTTAPASKKSTNVRPTTRARLAGTRASFAVLDRLAPRLAGRWAARLWLTLPRTRIPLPDDRPIPGLFVAPSERITVDLAGGRTIATERWGEGGRPVYLVHGWGGWRGQLGSFVEPLLARGCTVVAIDLPSHGDSGPGELGLRRTHGVEMVAALNAVIEHHGPPRAIVAHSLGCAITSFAIADGLPVPARLGFVAPTVGPVAHIRSTIQLLGGSQRTENAMIDRITSIVGRPITDFDSTTLSGPKPATLIVHDQLDKEVPHREADRIAAAWPDVELHSTTGLGHRRILRDQAVIEKIANFVAG